LYLEKSNFSASAWNGPREIPAIAFMKLLEPVLVAVELLEHRLSGVLDLV